MRIVAAVILSLIGFQAQAGETRCYKAKPSAERSQWFQGLTINEPARKRLGITYRSCCDSGDAVCTQFDHHDGSWWFLDPVDKKWKVVPPDIIKWETPSYDGNGYLFRNSDGLLCFIPPGGSS